MPAGRAGHPIMAFQAQAADSAGTVQYAGEKRHWHRHRLVSRAARACGPRPARAGRHRWMVAGRNSQVAVGAGAGQVAAASLQPHAFWVHGLSQVVLLYARVLLVERRVLFTPAPPRPD
jgi:hypothetical protein